MTSTVPVRVPPIADTKVVVVGALVPDVRVVVTYCGNGSMISTVPVTEPVAEFNVNVSLGDVPTVIVKVVYCGAFEGTMISTVPVKILEVGFGVASVIVDETLPDVVVKVV